MKSSKLKNIFVKSGKFWQEEVVVDSEIFDDVYLEAATRVLESKKNQPNLEITVIMECWEKKDLKKPLKHFCYNTYFVLVNAGLYNKAEMLRANFLKMFNTDLKKENIHGDGKPNDPGLN